MKWMIASDIHGSAYYLEKLMGAWEGEKPDKLLLLGDLLYHGPRNDLPKGYDPKQVISMLNGLKQEILCVRGNCDAQVDQMVLEFPIMADYAVLSLERKMIFATHGHLYSQKNPPMLKAGDILLCGHTHVPACRKEEGYFYLNPGSVSIPKEGSEHSYMIWEGKDFTWKSLEGRPYMGFQPL